MAQDKEAQFKARQAQKISQQGDLGKRAVEAEAKVAALETNAVTRAAHDAAIKAEKDAKDAALQAKAAAENNLPKVNGQPVTQQQVDDAQIEIAQLRSNTIPAGKKLVDDAAVVLGAGEKVVADTAVVLGAGERAISEQDYQQLTQNTVPAGKKLVDDVVYNQGLLNTLILKAVASQFIDDQSNTVFSKDHVAPLVGHACANQQVQSWIVEPKIGSALDLTHFCEHAVVDANGVAQDYTVDIN